MSIYKAPQWKRGRMDDTNNLRRIMDKETPPARAFSPVLPGYLLDYPSKLFVETTTHCNLGCVMCVKQTKDCEVAEGDMTLATFAALEPVFPRLEALILNGIGEPLLNPHLENFIRQAKLAMPAVGWIGFQSNGVLLTEPRAFSLMEAGLDRICLSLDAASPEVFKMLREGGGLPDVERALAALATAKRRGNRPDFQVGIEFVVMRSNLAELPAALRWAADRGAAFAIVTHLLPYDERHVTETAYNSCTAAAVALFKTYQDAAERQGLDMSRYFEARWKYRRNDAEQQLIAHVDAMQAQAYESKLFLDMKKLLQMDIDGMKAAAAVFDRARVVAEECGLALHLPEIHLRDKRHCTFVEAGGAFVSWTGNVSPCYFLWHRYRCFAGGWRQQVHAKVFGNATEQPVLAIWNSPAYKAFRAQAADYDYPDCSSCGFAPCDYVQTEQFEQDCHVGEVPCGSCLWCRGVFQCLQ